MCIIKYIHTDIHREWMNVLYVIYGESYNVTFMGPFPVAWRHIWKETFEPVLIVVPCRTQSLRPNPDRSSPAIQIKKKRRTARDIRTDREVAMKIDFSNINLQYLIQFRDVAFEWGSFDQNQRPYVPQVARSPQNRDKICLLSPSKRLGPRIV